MDALHSIDGLTPQEADRQGAAKISYYLAQDAERAELEASITRSLERLEVRYRLICGFS